jgi:hypothetical protein
MSLFTLDEDQDQADSFTERYPVDDDHGGALAIDTAIGDGLITGPDGWEIAVDLLANLDGELDGYRILVTRPGQAWYLASEVLSVLPGTEPDTMDVFREAVTAANDLLAAWTTRTSAETATHQEWTAQRAREFGAESEKPAVAREQDRRMGPSRKPRNTEPKAGK